MLLESPTPGCRRCQLQHHLCLRSVDAISYVRLLVHCGFQMASLEAVTFEGCIICYEIRTLLVEWYLPIARSGVECGEVLYSCKSGGYLVDCWELEMLTLNCPVSWVDQCICEVFRSSSLPPPLSSPSRSVCLLLQ